MREIVDSDCPPDLEGIANCDALAIGMIKEVVDRPAPRIDTAKHGRRGLNRAANRLLRVPGFSPVDGWIPSRHFGSHRAVVAAIEIAGKGYPGYATALGTIALTCSFANIVGGFMITDRMLRMFKSRSFLSRSTN